MGIVVEQIANVPIRYDGLDADRHQIELYLLGESIRGIARVLAVTAHFAATGQYAKQHQALETRVYVSEASANCYVLGAVIQFAKQQQLFSGSIGAVLGVILSWLIARASNSRQEMRAIKDSLDKAIEKLADGNRDLSERYLATIERMAESLRPSLRAAVAPVGKTCSTLKIGESTQVDQAIADAIRATDPDELTEERTWIIRVTELDLESASAKIRFESSEENDEGRMRAVITDPAIRILNNRYIAAFAAQTPISVRGKGVLKDGEIVSLYISDSIVT